MVSSFCSFSGTGEISSAGHGHSDMDGGGALLSSVWYRKCDSNGVRCPPSGDDSERVSSRRRRETISIPRINACNSGPPSRSALYVWLAGFGPQPVVLVLVLIACASACEGCPASRRLYRASPATATIARVQFCFAFPFAFSESSSCSCVIVASIAGSTTTAPTRRPSPASSASWATFCASAR